MSAERVVVTAIVTSEHGVLLCHRIDGKPEFSFPGGEWEDGESSQECAARETAEETGLTVVIGTLLGERVHPKTGRRMLYYAATPTDEDTRVKVGDTDEHDRVEWVPWSEAEERLPHLFEPVRQHLVATIG